MEMRNAVDDGKVQSTNDGSAIPIYEGWHLSGSIKLRDYPHEMVRFMCKKCGRMGQYRKQHLINRYGPDITLPDLRVKIANCERQGKMHDACGVHYIGWRVRDLSGGVHVGICPIQNGGLRCLLMQSSRH